MNLSQQTFLDLLVDVDSKSTNHNFYTFKKEDDGYLSPMQMASLYTNSALLVTIMGFLKEQLWLKNKEDKELGEETSYENFITPYFIKELQPILFLKDFLVKSGSKKIKEIERKSKSIEDKALSLITSRSASDQKYFAIESLKTMTQYFIDEESEQEGKLTGDAHRGLRLYRTFDGLDEIFNFNYQLDKELIVDHSIKERLFEGAGVGVQSGYSTILLALNHIDSKHGAKIIDLGSGYGRVGLVCSLLRPDIEFVGYEYVTHRVDVGNISKSFLGLEKSLDFKTQDLSLESFRIPNADVYYMYDPFTKETYEYVLKQIVELSKIKKVVIVTKGNARSWLVDISKENSWPKPEFIDEGNLCIFSSC